MNKAIMVELLPGQIFRATLLVLDASGRAAIADMAEGLTVPAAVDALLMSNDDVHAVIVPEGIEDAVRFGDRWAISPDMLSLAEVAEYFVDGGERNPDLVKKDEAATLYWQSNTWGG